MSVRFLAWLALVAALLTTRFASAQDQRSGEFTVQRFFPAPGPRNFITVQGARTDGKNAFSLGLMGNYARDPFVIRTCVSATDCTAANAALIRQIHIVETLVTGDLLASFTVIPRLQFGLRLPYTFAHGAGITTDPRDPAVGQQARGGLRGSGIGDPMLEAKFRAIGSSTDAHVLGITLFGTAPLAHAISSTKDRFIGDSSPTLGARAIYDAQFGRFGFALNAAGVYRKEAFVGSARLGPEFRYGAGAVFQVSPILNVLAEAFGATRFNTVAGTNALEGALALQLHPMRSNLSFLAGAGTSFIEGVGAPKLRVFAGGAFTNESSDQDNDQIDDDKDQCATAPEDFDGYQDQDGCPDPDNDGDGFADARDKCRNLPETKNGFQDDDGCPDEVADRDHDTVPDSEDKCPDQGGTTAIQRKGDFYGCPDRDRDGFADKVDKCPEQPEDTDGYQDQDGCPDPDNDGDGVNDVDDQCGEQPETKNGYQDDDGCPDEVPDSDHDGIVGDKDKCPNEPENYNGFEDDDGCIDKGPALAELRADQIKILDVVNFAKASDKIVGKKSFLVLDAVAALLVHHPEITKLEVAGHTDGMGDPAQNRDLSKRRAAAVVAYLTGRGVDATRLTAAGYGPDRSIADNRTAANRAKNRRVEFVIQSSTKKPSGSEEQP
jgi:OmpA-OmpF porin, OOP family